MAGKKKKATPKMKAMESCESCTDCSGFSKLEIWMLVFLGALGLLSALKFFDFGQNNFYFQLVWSVLVLVIGMIKLIGVKCD